MREHYSLDRLIEYGTEPIPDTISAVNPSWRQLDSQIRSQAGKRHRLVAQFGALALSEDPAESELHRFQQREGQLREEIQALDLEIDNLKKLRKSTPHHIAVKSLPEEDRFTRLRTERKHCIDTLKMIAYRAESSMASLLREHLARGGDDGRALLRQIFQTDADLTPDLATNTLTVRLKPSHACSSRPGHRETARRSQCYADRVPWHPAYIGFQTRVRMISPRSGGLNILMNVQDASRFNRSGCQTRKVLVQASVLECVNNVL